MKKLIMKLLGIDNDIVAINYHIELLRKENEELKKSLAELDEKVEEIEVPDMDDYVAHSDLDDNIESYLNNNDYATQSYVDDEIESKVSDSVDEKIDDLDLTDKVEEVVKDMDKASFGDTQELKDEITRQLRVMFMDELEIKIKLK